MRVALYARVSTQRQAQAQSVEQQLDRLKKYADEQGWRVPIENVFRDDGYSGASLKRLGLDRLRDQAAARTLDLVLITAPDRLARNYVHQVVLLEELEQHGCQVQFLDRPMSHDPHDQLLLQIRGAVAEYERTLITERMRRGRQRKLAAGLLDETAFRLPCGPGPSTRSGRRTDRRIRSRHCARDVCLVCGGVAQFLFAGPPAS